MLKLAVEVQGAGDGCLRRGYRADIRSEVGVTGRIQQQRTLCLVRCEFSIGEKCRSLCFITFPVEFY